MRVALIVNRFPEVSETFVVRRFLGLLERGWDVHVFCEQSTQDTWRSFPKLGDPALRRRVHVRRRTSSHIRIVFVLPVVFIRALLLTPLRTLRYTVRGLRVYGRGTAGHLVEDAALLRFGPDILHFEFGHLAVRREAVADLLGCALVASFQGFDMNYVGLEEPGYYDTLWERLDAAHFVSYDLFERAKSRGFPSDGPASVVYNGIDIVDFSAPDRNHMDVVGSPDRPVRLLSVGRLHWKKGYSFALQAVQLLADAGIHCEYRIIGDGENREAIAFTRHDLGLPTVTMLGAQSSDRVREEMLWADIFLHAATSEGFCIAVTEAQAVGLPVVVSDADGLRENVADGETGFVVRRRDPAGLAEKVRDLARDPALRDRMGRAGSERAKVRFPLSAHIDGIETIYRAAVSRRTERATRSPGG